MGNILTDNILTVQYNSPKTYCFLSLLGAYRLSAIFMFIVDNMTFNYVSVTFILNNVFSGDTPGKI